MRRGRFRGGFCDRSPLTARKPATTSAMSGGGRQGPADGCWSLRLAIGCPHATPSTPVRGRRYFSLLRRHEQELERRLLDIVLTLLELIAEKREEVVRLGRDRIGREVRERVQRRIGLAQVLL